MVYLNISLRLGNIVLKHVSDNNHGIHTSYI